MGRFFYFLLLLLPAANGNAQSDSTALKDLGNTVAVPHEDTDEKVFTRVEEEAVFPGGDKAWQRYMQNALDANTPTKNGAPKGRYTVIVRFIVSKTGEIRDVITESTHGFEMEKEARRIIKIGPRWTPARQNGRNVDSYRRQPVTFVVE